ncbi:MAG: hypothetical protein IPK52_03290 [Chloroflexi bacterium]|nr:hypothetical protein [Chloroflexota bacterium]
MTNRNDDDFNFDDDLFGSDPTPDTDADLNFDDDPLGNIGGIGSDDFSFDDEEEEGGRTNRTFVVLAFIIILLFIAGVAAIVLFALNRGPTDIDRTRTAIAQFNSTQQAFALETATESANNVRLTATAAVLEVTQTGIAAQQATGAAAIAQTQAAVDATQTALAQPSGTPSPTFEATVDLTGTAAVVQTELPPGLAATALAATQTQLAADALATQEALNAAALETQAAATLFAAQTEAAANPATATGQITPGGISPEDVRLTATALSQTLSPSTPVATSAIGGTPVAIVPTRLPETGLFDDIAGGNSFGVLALVALGLVGVIFGARRLRK